MKLLNKQEFLKSLNESKEDVITIDADVSIDPEEETEALAGFKEYSIDYEETGDTTANLTGTKENLIKYLTSDYYGLDIRDLKELWPELFESKDDWNSIDNDLYDLKKSFRKKFTAMSSNQIMIKAAKEISKKYKIAVKEILKKETPDNNLKGDKTWDKEGNIK